MLSLDTKGSLERNISSLIKLLSKVPAFVMVTEWLAIALVGMFAVTNISMTLASSCHYEFCQLNFELIVVGRGILVSN